MGSRSSDGASADEEPRKENEEVTETSTDPQLTARVHRNVLERKRKERIKLLINQIREQIPDDFLPYNLKKPLSNNVVLETTVAYIKRIKEQNALYSSGHGGEAQDDEIKRLKAELVQVKSERDAFEKLANASASSTLSVSHAKAASVGTPAAASSGDSSTSHVPVTTAKLPGQGWIITQSGQAYYVNENGVPIAQATAQQVLGSAPTTVATSDAPKSGVTTVTSSSNSEAVSTTTSNSADPNQRATGMPTLLPGQPLANGLVNLPANSNGQLPGAILLPNGQLISVLTGASNTSATPGAVAPSTSTTTAITSVPTSIDLTPTSAPLTSNMMLLGQQPVLSNIMMNSGQPSLVDHSANQLGRKIMPKPSHSFAQPLMAPISLAPLPLPAMSSSTALSINNAVPMSISQNVASASKTGEAASAEVPVKKKRAGRKKAKKKEDTGEQVSAGDILAEATASLFSPGSATADNKVAGPTVMDGVVKSLPSPSKADTKPEKGQDNVQPAGKVSDKKGTKRKLKQNSEVDPSKDASTNATPIKKAKANRSRNKKDGKNVMAPEPPVESNLPAKTIATSADNPNDSQTAIVFDPTELDMVLDQMENDINQTTVSNKDDQEPQSLKPSDDLLLLNDGEVLGTVYSSDAQGNKENNSVVKPTFQNKEQQPERAASPTPSLAASTITTVSQTSSYALPDDYNVADITKPTSEPVDHRRQATRSTSNVDSDVSSAYNVKSNRPAPVHTDRPPQGMSNSELKVEPLSTRSQTLHENGKVETPAPKEKPREHQQQQQQQLQQPATSVHQQQRDVSSSPTYKPAIRSNPREDNPPDWSHAAHNTHRNSRPSEQSNHSMPQSANIIPPAEPMRADDVRSSHKVKPAWSPARETESQMNQNTAGGKQGYRSANQQEKVTPPAHHKRLQSTADSPTTSSPYQYTLFNSENPNQTLNNRQMPPPAIPDYAAGLHGQPWNYPPQLDSNTNSVTKKSLPSPQKRTETNRLSQQSGVPIHRSPSADRSASNMPSYGSNKMDDQLPVDYRFNPPSLTPTTTHIKHNSFSTESLLSKASERSLHHPKPTIDPTSKPYGNSSAITNQHMYDKDRNYMTTQPSEHVPYNVNLFSTPTSTPHSLSAFKSQNSAAAFQQNIMQNSAFPFSFGRTAHGQQDTFNDISPSKLAYNAPKPALPFYLQPSQPVSMHNPITVDRGNNDSERPSSRRSQGRETHQQYPAALDGCVMPQKSTVQNQERPASAHKPKKNKSTPSVPAGITTSVSPYGTSVSEAAGLPYQFPSSPYLQTAFHKPRNEATSVSNAPDLFNPHTFRKSVGQPFGLPFQAPSFPGLPPHSAQSFVHPNASQLASAPQFNFNNIFKDNPPDNFRLPGAAPPSGLYSPSPSQLYTNPLSINNFLGSSGSGFDRHRTPNPMPGFPGQHPGFSNRFPSTFDFQLPDQQQ